MSASTDPGAGEPTTPLRPRRRSRGLRVPAPAPVAPGVPTTAPAVEPDAAPAVEDATPDEDTTAPAAVPAAVAAVTTAAPLRVPGPTAGTGPPTAAGPTRSSGGIGPLGPPPLLPAGGPPPPPPSGPPDRRVAVVGRAVLALVLVAAVVGTVVVLQQRSQFGRTDAGSEEIPALEVAPAPVELGSVAQPTAIAPPSSLLPGTNAQPSSGTSAAETVSSWANGLGPRTNIPPIALQAYGIADLTMRQQDPGCKLSWVTVAGLARIESNHGRYRGSSIAANGDVTPRIIGVPLDGTSGNRTIGDTDGGALDGDPTLDRAVGPLQFIPSTWARWRSDGNDDGIADPNNIFDAALAAGRYLCAGGRDLSTGQGWRAAVLSYNNSDDYGRRVYAAAQAYANSTSP